VPAHHLEQPEVVRVELVEPELGDDDHAGHPGPVLERDREERLLDVRRTLDPLAELVIRRVTDEERGARLGDPARDPAADLGRQEQGGIGRRGSGEIAAKRERHEIVLVPEEHTAVVVVEELAELVRDREADLDDVVQTGELPGEALEHLQVRDRADVVAPDALLGGPLAVALVERDDEPVASRLGRHHRGLRAGDELARVRGVLGAEGDTCRHGETPDCVGVELSELLADALGESRGASEVAGRKDHGELLAADTADDVRRTDARA
jgi:hypothetical protein